MTWRGEHYEFGLDKQSYIIFHIIECGVILGSDFTLASGNERLKPRRSSA